MGLEEPNDLGPLGAGRGQRIQLRVVQKPLFRPDAEVDHLVYEASVSKEVAVVRPVGHRFSVVKLVANVAPLFGAGE